VPRDQNEAPDRGEGRRRISKVLAAKTRAKNQAALEALSSRRRRFAKAGHESTIPGIVTVTDFSESFPTGRPLYLVMEMVRGRKTCSIVKEMKAR